jgi:RNA polymerase sigma factor (sigma-70 family)
MPQAVEILRSGLPRENWSDARLIKECVAGSEDAWRALIERYKKLVYSIPRKLGLSSSDANDVFQQVCLQLVSSLPALREPKSLPGWIIKVTAHRCFQLAGRDQHIKSVDLATHGGVIANERPLPDRILDELEQEQMLREALTELPARCREMIRMLFFETPPVPYEEVARSLGLATGSIGFIRMRCLKSLRHRLDRKGFA